MDIYLTLDARTAQWYQDMEDRIEEYIAKGAMDRSKVMGELTKTYESLIGKVEKIRKETGELVRLCIMPVLGERIDYGNGKIYLQTSIPDVPKELEATPKNLIYSYRALTRVNLSEYMILKHATDRMENYLRNKQTHLPTVNPELAKGKPIRD
jgi:hypothetical protein